MSRQDAFKQLLGSVQQDLRDYPRLQQQLEEQFAAALAHDSQRLALCASGIGELCEQLNASRRLRKRLAQAVLLREHDLSMTAVLALLPAQARGVCQQRWQQLLAHVSCCHELNLRNGRLLQQQQQLLQRVLEGESDVYLAQ